MAHDVRILGCISNRVKSLRSNFEPISSFRRSCESDISSCMKAVSKRIRPLGRHETDKGHWKVRIPLPPISASPNHVMSTNSELVLKVHVCHSLANVAVECFALQQA